MEVSKEHLRHIMLYEYKKGNSAAEATRNIHSVYGKECLNERTCRRWFAKFRSGDFSLEDEDRTGRPVEFDDKLLEALLEENPALSVEELAIKLSSNHTTVHRHLQQLGKVPKLGKWVPHELSESNRKSRVDICSSLHSRELISPFLDRLVTGDEKWIFYRNVKRRKQWLGKREKAQPQPRRELHGKKVLLSIWWDCKGVIHFELLPPNATINAQVYCQQLERLNQALKKKRPALVNRKGVMFHQDNARPHTAKITSQKIEELGWEKIPHPPYSPDLAPSDYHLFRSLQNHLGDITFASQEEVETDISEFFALKPKEFYIDGIKKLVNRWKEVIDNQGKYIDD